MAKASKNLLAVLLIITMLMSVIGTLAALSVTLSYPGYSVVPVDVEGERPDQSFGEVSVNLLPPPTVVTGRVAATLLSEEV
jgi:hypothetical protein